MSKRTSFAGAGTAIITPFTKDGAIDEKAFRRLVKRQVDEGIDVLVPCGTTGESATMTADEQQRVIAITVAEVAGRIPVVAGASSNDTRVAVDRTRAVCALGVDGVLSVAPFYNKPTQEGLYRHFSAVAEASTVPVMVYNVPGRTASNIEVKTLMRLAEHGNVRAVKEASGNLAQVMEILRSRPDTLQVLSGDDAYTLAYMALGAEGVISVAANQVPGPMHELVAAAAKGDFQEARRIHNRLLPLMNLNFVESSPVPVKTGMALLGFCEENFRLPMCPGMDSTRESMRATLRDLGLLS